jgi:hypothetical protein
MSSSQDVYIGPYAEWLVAGSEPQPVPRDLLGALCCNFGRSEPLEMDSGGGEFFRCCFMPDEDRPGQPSREMYFSGGTTAAEDLTGVGVQKETEWFARAFANELRALASHYGTPAALRWGVVTWWP